jgi:hypothetical protein
MVKGRLHKNDWFVTLVFSLLFLIGVINGAAFLEQRVHIVYGLGDLGIQSVPHNPSSAENIASIAIDAESIQKIGHWPWPRGVLAELVKRLSAADARIIGLQTFLSGPRTGKEYRRQALHACLEQKKVSV